MKLYISPGACSLSPHIVLREAGLKFDLDVVNLGTKQLKSGGDFLAVNSKGYVPALALDSGDVLTEGPAIVQWIADQNPDSKLAPKAGTIERYRLQEWLNFISTELHKSFSPLFNKTTPDATKQAFSERIVGRVAWLDKQLAGKQYLLGDNFSVADAYLFTVLSWTKHVGVDISPYSNVTSLLERIAARPAVKAALEAEKALR